MVSSKTEILNRDQIKQKIERLSYQIYEDNVDEKEIILAGMQGNGFLMAELIASTLKKISPLQVHMVKISMDKKNPLNGETTLNPSTIQYKNKVVVVADDVLNSGKTLIYGMRVFLELPIKKMRTVVLVDRNHKKFPISADFTGVSMATTLQEHITVVLDKGAECAYLE
jgi:pyrimidine operon attenuation protein/uracil phosphoribosyltransferase